MILGIFSLFFAPRFFIRYEEPLITIILLLGLYLQSTPFMKLCILLLAILASIYAYSPDLGQKLCRLTVASYCAPSKVKDWSCKPCNDSPIKLSNVQPFYNSTGDVLGLIGVSASPSAIYLVFRGTLPWDMKNWIQDIDFLKTNFPTCNNGCQVHRGFYHAYLQISSQVIKTVKDYQTRFKVSQVIVTGHSLGGALATHAAVHLVNEGVTVSEFYTFGCPRVGDVKFSNWFDAFIKSNSKFRITHGRDPVPHLPPEGFGFKHTPHEIFYKGFVREGYVTCNDNASKQDPYCSDKYIADVMVTDHLLYYDIDFAGIILGCQ